MQRRCSMGKEKGGAGSGFCSVNVARYSVEIWNTGNFPVDPVRTLSLSVSKWNRYSGHENQTEVPMSTPLFVLFAGSSTERLFALFFIYQGDKKPTVNVSQSGNLWEYSAHMRNVNNDALLYHSFLENKIMVKCNNFVMEFELYVCDNNGY